MPALESESESEGGSDADDDAGSQAGEQGPVRGNNANGELRLPVVGMETRGRVMGILWAHWEVRCPVTLLPHHNAASSVRCPSASLLQKHVCSSSNMLVGT